MSVTRATGLWFSGGAVLASAVLTAVLWPGGAFRADTNSGSDQTLGGGSFQAAASTPTAPSITSKPANPSSTTTAAFAYTGPSGATFQCALDASTFVSCAGTTSGSVSYTGLGQGSHTFQVRDVVAKTTSGATAYTWAVDTTPPPAPVLQQYPPDPTTGATQTFTWTEAESGTTFQCAAENGIYASCTSPYTYVVNTNNNGQHQFSVKAFDAAGNASAATNYSFKVAKDTATTGVQFSVTGDVGGLVPGVWRPITVHITNPNASAIYVTSLTVQVSNSPSSCAAADNIELQQSPVSSSSPVVVAANAGSDVPAASAPRIRLKDLPTNQDACKGASFTLAYSGSAHN